MSRFDMVGGAPEYATIERTLRLCSLMLFGYLAGIGSFHVIPA